MTSGLQATNALSEFAASLRFEQIPSDVIATTKNVILDSFGCAVAATTIGDGCPEVLDFMTRSGDAPQSGIIGTSLQVSAPNAAFANGALVHALNYDPIGEVVGHIGVVCLPAALAVAEAKGKVSGKELLTAAVIAGEVTARVVGAIARTGRHPSEKHLAGQLLGYFGAAAGAGRMVNLTPRQMASALGLALMQMAGSRQVVLTGDPPAKAIYGAFPNHGGVTSALLARSGLDAACDVFGEPAGLYSMIYGGSGLVNTIAEQLGERYWLNDVEFKPWPTSAKLHPFIEAAAEAHRDIRDAGLVARVEIRTPPSLRPWCEPIEKRRHPDNAAAAANSVPFCTARALICGNVTLGDFVPKGLQDPATGRLADRISCTDDVETSISVALTDGSQRHYATQSPLGSLARPISVERLAKKFFDCCRHALVPIDEVRASELQSMILNLEAIEDVASITQRASGRRA